MTMEEECSIPSYLGLDLMNKKKYWKQCDFSWKCSLEPNERCVEKVYVGPLRNMKIPVQCPKCLDYYCRNHVLDFQNGMCPICYYSRRKDLLREFKKNKCWWL